MTQEQHPITPPDELVQQWDEEGTELFRPAYQRHIATQAARWGHQPVPPPEGELSDNPPVPISAHDLAIQWNQQADQFNQWDSLDLDEQLGWAQARAIALDRSRRAPVEPAEHEKGLHSKYIIHRSRDGSPVDYPCFVLRLDGSDPAAMSAMRAYAEDPACPPELAGDLAVYCAIPAQVPPRPTDEEIGEWADACSEAPLEELDPEIHGWRRCFTAQEFGETIRAALARWGNTTPQPVPVSERLPEANIKVLAHYFNALGKGRTVCAVWVPAKTRSEDIDSSDDDFQEYDEETDRFYWPEGWYEAIENWEDLGWVRIYEGEVVYWQPLPKWPAHALPTPGDNQQ